MKRNVIGIIGILILFTKCAFFAATPSIPSGRYRTTVASLIKRVLPANGSAYTVFDYYVGSKRYQDVGEAPMPWVPMHEKYLFKYDTLHPENQENANVIREHPVFLPREITRYTYATLEKMGAKDQLFGFKYIILGKKYERLQLLADGDPVRNHPQMVSGAKFVLEYWVQNPERAILYINRPVNDSMPVPSDPNTDVLRPIWDSIPVLLPDPEMIKFQPGW